MTHSQTTCRGLLRAGGAVVAAAALAGCSAFGQNEQRVGFEYEAQRVVGFIRVEGVVRNVGEAFVEEITVQCDVYNAEDDVLKTKRTQYTKSMSIKKSRSVSGSTSVSSRG
jgi:hypothetical protein